MWERAHRGSRSPGHRWDRRQRCCPTAQEAQLWTGQRRAEAGAREPWAQREGRVCLGCAGPGGLGKRFCQKAGYL